jgi:predicted amidohydrolase YtcJ
MKNRVLITGISIALALLLAGLLLFFVRSRDVALVLINGKIYTVNDKQPLAEAIAIDEGMIVAVGTTREIESSYKPRKSIDLLGKSVVPGFIDSHAHIENLGIMLENLSVYGARSPEEIQSLLARQIASRPKGSWIRGRGWDQNLWKNKAFPTHAMLDAVAPGNPVYLTRVDGHAVWVNAKALEVARIDRSAKDPEGGKILRDRDGNPTGVFVDNAIAMLNDVLPALTEQERTEAVRRAVSECLRCGLTEVHDMGVDREEIGIYKKMIQDRTFPFRIYAAVEGKDLWEEYMKTGPEIGGNAGRLTVRALKLYADGALGSRGAALIEPYSDDPVNRGLTLTSEKELHTAIQQAFDHGFQPCVHAIGDRANNIVLNVYESVLAASKNRSRDVRFRIEHAQVLDSQDIPRFYALGVLPVMQPSHCTSDMGWAVDRLGPKRCAGAYAWRALLKTGTIIPGGSDFPVESPNPLWGFYAAITRQDLSGQPEGGWYPEQRMTREEALKAFTIWSAMAGFQEKNLGSIERGKWADLTILSDDIMTIDPPRILTTKVSMTLVAGEIVFTADDGQDVGLPKPTP